jgi:hypothetical protein
VGIAASYAFAAALIPWHMASVALNMILGWSREVSETASETAYSVS